MDYITLSLAMWVFLTLTQAARHGFSVTFDRLGSFYMASSMKFVKMFGGVWWALIGAPLAAFFIIIFFFSSPYPINAQTVFTTLQTFSGPGLPYVLLFILLWAIFAFGYFGAGAIYQRRKSKR